MTRAENAWYRYATVCLRQSPALSKSALRGLLRLHAFGAAGGFCAAVTASVLQPQLQGCRRSSSLRQRLCHCGVGTTAASGQLQTAGAAALEKEAARLDTDLGDCADDADFEEW